MSNYTHDVLLKESRPRASNSTALIIADSKSIGENERNKKKSGRAADRGKIADILHVEGNIIGFV
jgi:hypothetical protein